jgi:HK97 gp10 family phage protein
VTDWFSSAAIDEAVIRAGSRALDSGGHRIAGRAKDLAPVRKVFAGQGKSYRVRIKSIDEIEADRAQRKSLGLGPERTHFRPPTIVTHRAPQLLSLRTVAPSAPPHLALPSAQDRLDRRGRYELKTGRATFGGQLGGHLRDQIYSTAPIVDGRIIRVKVISPAPYSKYQEFGTGHNPAHPFMRPAAHENRDSLASEIAREIIAEVTPLFTGRVEVTVHSRLRGGVSG